RGGYICRRGLRNELSVFRPHRYISFATCESARASARTRRHETGRAGGLSAYMWHADAKRHNEKLRHRRIRQARQRTVGNIVKEGLFLPTANEKETCFQRSIYALYTVLTSIP